MAKVNGKLRATIIFSCISVFVILVGWGSSFVTAKVNRAKTEQEIGDTMDSHSFWIGKLETNVEEIKKDTSLIKETLGRHDERLKNLKEQYNSIDDKLDKIWSKIK